MFKKFALASALILLPAALIAQTFAPGFPIINGPSYCQSTVNAVCTQTVPAGPSLTGNETVPVDTNTTASGPTSAKIGLPALGAGTMVVSVPVTGATLTVTQQERQRIVNPAGTIAALTINLPAASANMVNGQRIGICGTQIVTTLTMGAGTGNTFSTTAPTAMLVPVVTGAASCFEFIYEKTSASVGVWHRTQ